MTSEKSLCSPGSRLHAAGAEFSVRSSSAQRIELCLFDRADAPAERARIPLVREDDDHWTLTVDGLGAGAVYGYRAYGPWDPRNGLCFNGEKLLVDPLAQAVCGSTRWHPALLAHDKHDPRRPDSRDSAPWAPRCVLLPNQDRTPNHPRRSWSDTVIYECHVRGMTARHPELPPQLRGTYLGLASPPLLEHFLALGITALELLPVQQHFDEERIVGRKQTNYWGYAPLGFCAPDARFAGGDTGEQVDEFASMVATLHDAGIEVLLDVVFNHSAEGDRRGPALSLRGLDDAAYYLRDAHGAYTNWTGCGNTLASQHSATIELVLAALGQWVALGVDGFRFDLAAVLGRHAHGEFDAGAPLLAAIVEDPALAGTKLIAEPWDLGPGEVGPGRFRDPWREWNDAFRNDLRSVWRGNDVSLAGLATRLAGSSDLFAGSRQGPSASINIIISHDGFTLADWTSYECKRNDANGENGRDGNDHEQSRAWGMEGPSDDADVMLARNKAAAGMLASLFLSLGVPMLAHGDELGRTQGGNNNPYCIDDETTWVDWHLDEYGLARLSLTKELAALRRRFVSLRRQSFLEGVAPSDGGLADVTWFHPSGRPMQQHDWEDRSLGLLAVVLASDAERLLMVFNPPERAARLVFPDGVGLPVGWKLLLHTDAFCGIAARGRGESVARRLFDPGATMDFTGGAVAVFQGMTA